MALRHHNGPLHFVPYGALGSVRNTSRDWVIDKFNLPLPIEVESEKIRKMIKKIGEEMLTDPDVGPLIIETLKGSDAALRCYAAGGLRRLGAAAKEAVPVLIRTRAKAEYSAKKK